MASASTFEDAFTTKVGGTVQTSVYTVNVNVRYEMDLDDETTDRIAAALDARQRRRGGRPRFGDR